MSDVDTEPLQAPVIYLDNSPLALAIVAIVDEMLCENSHREAA